MTPNKPPYVKTMAENIGQTPVQLQAERKGIVKYLFLFICFEGPFGNKIKSIDKGKKRKKQSVFTDLLQMNVHVHREIGKLVLRRS